MSDYIVRATAADASIRAFAITSRDLVETARKDHNTSPIMTAALGRLLSGGAMMGTMLKGDKDLLTLQIQCSGPAKGLTVTADAHGNVKGFASNPVVELPPNADGHLNVGGALDLGILSVIKDMGLKEPYVGQCQLQTGEIAEGWSIDLDPEIHDVLNKRTDKTWPTTWFVPRLDPTRDAFKDVYSVMNNWGANHGAIAYGQDHQQQAYLRSLARQDHACEVQRHHPGGFCC